MLQLKLLSIPETARALDCDHRTVRRMVDEGALPSVLIGRQQGISEDILHQWIERGGAIPKPAKARI